MGKIEFPRWIYKGKTEKKIVECMADYQAALKNGWREGVIDEAETDDSEQLKKLGTDVKYVRKEVKKISLGVDALLAASDQNPMVGLMPEDDDDAAATELPEAPLTHRQMLEEKARKLKIDFTAKTSDARLAAMIQRRG